MSVALLIGLTGLALGFLALFALLAPASLQAADRSPGTHDIDAVGATWQPSSVEAELGDDLRWNFPTETAQMPHDVWLVPPGGDPAPSGDIFEVTDGFVFPGGASVSHTLDEEGTWTFVCRVHAGFSDGRWSGMVGSATISDEPGIDFEAYERPDPTLPAVPAGAVKRFVVDVYEHVTKVADDRPPTRVWSFGVNGKLNRGTGASQPIVVNQHDEVEIVLRNGSSEAMGVTMPHSIDLHAAHVNPDAAFANVAPGATHTFRFTARNAGVFMYHCGSAPVLHHVGAGMAGMIVVKPPNLEPVDRELWMVQQEFYLGEPGADADYGKMLDQRPDVIVFNGYANQYAAEPIAVNADERIRMYVVNAGPTIWSAFHVIGTVFDRAVTDNGVATDVQTVNLAPSQGGFVEFQLDDPGNYPFVNHSFGNMVKGSVGVLAAGSSAGPPPSPPMVHGFADPASGVAPLHVRFSATGLNPDGGALSFRWSLAPRGNVFDPLFEHTFTSAGEYTATVTATNEQGASSSDSVTVTVTDPPAHHASPAPAPEPARAPEATGATKATPTRTTATVKRLQGHGVRVTVTCRATATARVTVTVSRSVSKRLRLSSPTVASKRVRCVSGRTVTVQVRPTRSAARRLARVKRVPAAVNVTVGRERVRKSVALQQRL